MNTLGHSINTSALSLQTFGRHAKPLLEGLKNKTEETEVTSQENTAVSAASNQTVTDNHGDVSASDITSQTTKVNPVTTKLKPSVVSEESLEKKTHDKSTEPTTTKSPAQDVKTESHHRQSTRIPGANLSYHDTHNQSSENTNSLAEASEQLCDCKLRNNVTDGEKTSDIQRRETLLKLKKA